MLSVSCEIPVPLLCLHFSENGDTGDTICAATQGMAALSVQETEGAERPHDDRSPPDSEVSAAEHSSQCSSVEQKVASREPAPSTPDKVVPTPCLWDPGNRRVTVTQTEGTCVTPGLSLPVGEMFIAAPRLSPRRSWTPSCPSAPQNLSLWMSS
ncbi:hypothetical protein FKM82_029447 [Ascaphus truei]